MSIGDFGLTAGERQSGSRRTSSWEVLLLIALVGSAAVVFGHYLLPVMSELLADGVESAM